MTPWRFFCFLITSVAVPSLLISSTEGIDSQDRDGKEMQVIDGTKNDTPPGNTLTAPTTTPTASLPVVNSEKCEDRSEYRYMKCPPGVPCDELPRSCLSCTFNCTCIYGQEVDVECKPIASSCATANYSMICRYCYQTEAWEQTCEGKYQCHAVSSPREMFTSNCTVRSDVLCLGNRSFFKRLPCNWTSGYKWSTALLLSITLGGFGADRFYLGHWQEGIGKLFSFGGLGVWTIMDVILIFIRYLGPADGSLYI